jgi:hypothetical protein
MDRFIGYSQVVTTINYNTLKITAVITPEINSSTSACLFGNDSGLVNTSATEYSIIWVWILCYDRQTVGKSILE